MSAASDPAADKATAPDAAATWSGVFYDGHSNRKRPVTLRAIAGPAPDGVLEIVEDGAVVAVWPSADLRRADSAQVLRLACVSAPALARLEIADAQAAAAIAARSAALEDGQGRTQTMRIVGWSLAAACSIVLVTLYGIPLLADRMAPLVPVALEERLGEAVDRQVRTLLGDEICIGAEGQAALDAMMRKLVEAGGYRGPLHVHVLSSEMSNAFALPGGRLYLLDGLLQRSRHADEVAGVMAHELGHAHHRDGLRRMIQTGGSSFLIGLLFGDITGSGAVVFAARSILNASHSREAETRADEFAIASMQTLGRSPRPLGELLVRVTGGGKLATIVDSHPLSAERLRRMKEADATATGAPILTEAQWQALQGICKDKAPGAAGRR